MTKAIEQIVEELRRMPMLHFSLGGKELFHSNFLYWLATNEKYKQKTYNMLKEMAGVDADDSWNENDMECKREYLHFDFSIWKNGKPILLIENKVKSIPKLKQLKDYAEEVKKKNSEPHFILLLLMSQISGGEIKGKSILEINDGEGKTTEWRYVGYDKYRELLGKHFGDIDVSKDKEGIYIKDYCDFIEKLNELAEEWEKEHKQESNFFDKNNSEKYKDIRMYDVYEKIRVSSFASLLMQNKEVGLKPADVYFDYTHGEGLIGIDKNNGCRLCLQIQGKEYRRCIVIGNKESKTGNEQLGKKIWKIIEADKKLIGFFYFGNPKKDISKLNGKRIMEKPYNQFITNDYIFLYRHDAIDEFATNEDVKKRVLDDWNIIKTLSIDKISSIIKKKKRRKPKIRRRRQI